MTSQQTSTKALTAGQQIARGDLLHSEMHRAYVRFVRWDGGLAVVADRNTLRELPDLCHPALLRRA